MQPSPDWKAAAVCHLPVQGNKTGPRSKEIQTVPLREQKSRMQWIFLFIRSLSGKSWIDPSPPLNYPAHPLLLPLGLCSHNAHPWKKSLFSLYPPHWLPSFLSLLGLTFPLKSSAAARYLRILSGCFGDILSVNRRRLSSSELCITPIAVCQKQRHHSQEEKHTDKEIENIQSTLEALPEGYQPSGASWDFAANHPDK